MDTGTQLAKHLNAIGARELSFEQASQLGIELVHHPDSDHNDIFHTASGDIVYWDEQRAQWELVEAGRNGTAVKSGDMERIHNPMVHHTARIAPTAIIDDTATIEPGAVIGPHAFVGPHAHVGTDATVGRYARITDGAYVGAYASVLDGSRVGPGAVIGTGSRVGPTANVGAGARLEQHTKVQSFDNIAAHSRVGNATLRDRPHDRYRSRDIATVIDRIAALDRD